VDRFLLKTCCYAVSATVNDAIGSDYSQSRGSHAQNRKGAVRSEETKKVSPRIMGHIFCPAGSGFPENSKIDLVILFG